MASKKKTSNGGGKAAPKKAAGGGGSAAKKSAPASAPAQKSKTPWIVAAVGVVVVIVAMTLAGLGSKAAGGTKADPQEAKYMGRLLPKGYQEPKVADVMLYDGATPMTPVTAADDGSALSVPVDQLVKAKNISFEYAKPGGKPIPLIAYVKPSGKAFVGVNFCPPCQGQGQTIQTDGTLTCDSCGTKRNIETGVGLSGTCKLYPLDELPAKVGGGKLTIEKTALDGWTAQPLDRKIGS